MKTIDTKDIYYSGMNIICDKIYKIKVEVGCRLEEHHVQVLASLMIIDRHLLLAFGDMTE